MRVSAGDPQIAEMFGLPVHPPGEFLLENAQGRLQLRDTRDGGPGPLYVDFDSPDIMRRVRAGRTLPLARAILGRGGGKPTMLDATAGLGRDAYTLAKLGCGVIALERSPVVAALLSDGLRRAGMELEVCVTDAVEFMAVTEHRTQVVYLDPMFPASNQSAGVKKEMQYFRDLLGADDTDALFEAAMRFATSRVVIKRPQHAARTHKPNHTFAGKTVRFDVHLV